MTQWTALLKCVQKSFCINSVSFKNPVAQSSFLSKSLTFTIQHQLNQNKVSWCCIINDNDFERNEHCATVFLIWTDFKMQMKNWSMVPSIKTSANFSWFLTKPSSMDLQKNTNALFSGYQYHICHLILRHFRLGCSVNQKRKRLKFVHSKTVSQSSFLSKSLSFSI